MKINYHNRIFRTVANEHNGETSSDTTFYYRQHMNIVTAEYSGGKILKGHLLGLVDMHGNIEMRYHQININEEIRTGICYSTPEILQNGKVRLHESWEWTTGNISSGRSIIEEV